MFSKIYINFILILFGLIALIGVGNAYAQQSANLKDTDKTLMHFYSKKLDDLGEKNKTMELGLINVQSELQVSTQTKVEIKESIKLIQQEPDESESKLAEIHYENRLLKQKLEQHLEHRDRFSSWSGFLLACVSVILTVLGIGIALLAFLGLQDIKKAAIESAVKQSESQVKIAIENGTFNEAMHNAVQRVIYRDILSEDDFPQNDKGLDNEDV